MVFLLLAVCGPTSVPVYICVVDVLYFFTCSPPFQLLHTSSLARKVTDTDEAVDHHDHDSAEEG